MTIKFRYDAFRPAGTEVVARLGLNKNDRYQPAQVVQACDLYVQPSAQNAEVVLNQLTQEQLSLDRPSRHVEPKEIAKIVLHILDAINPSFAETVQTAIQNGHFFFVPIMDPTKNPTRLIPIKETYSTVAQCGYDGTMQSLVNAMDMAAKLSLLDQMATAESLTETLSVQTQIHFLHRALFDASNLPGNARDLATDLAKAERANITMHSLNWRLAANLYSPAVARVSGAMDFSEENCKRAYMIHTQAAAPAMFIATALYDQLYKDAPPEKRAETAAILFPPKPADESLAMPNKLENMLALVGVNATYDLLELFERVAARLYSANRIELATSLGLRRVTTTDTRAQHYGR